MESILFQTESMKALYVNGELKRQDVHADEEYSNKLYIQQLKDVYEFDEEDEEDEDYGNFVKVVKIKTEDEPYLVNHHTFPSNINLLLNRKEF